MRRDRRSSRRLIPCLFVAAWGDAAIATAQTADDNAIAAASDAFGTTVGLDSIGIYGTSDVRGFSPQAAGNVRLEGLYFDRQGSLSPRLVQGSAIRVGLATRDYPSPSPTGIVDYRLVPLGDERTLALTAALNAYGGPALELDAAFPSVTSALGLTAGVSYAREEYYDGADARYLRAAFAPRWSFGESTTLTAFASYGRGEDEEVAPRVITAGAYLPPEIERRKYFGQEWADDETHRLDHGAIVRATLASGWALAGGLYRSVFDTPSGFAELYVDTQRDGLTREIVIADPQQLYESTSGDLRASRSFAGTHASHAIELALTGRHRTDRYGGSAAALDFGLRPLGERRPQPRPVDFVFGTRSEDRVRQLSVGVSYSGEWPRATLDVSLRRSDYRKSVTTPSRDTLTTLDDPWLWSALVTRRLTDRLAAYVGRVTGLEDNGIAPDDATNRNEALTAIRTRQWDAGLRWSIDSDSELLAGVFHIAKPYFATDSQGAFTELGVVTHEGIELSWTAKPLPIVNVIAGAVLLDPRVDGDAVRLGRIGRRPIGQTKTLVQTTVEVRPRTWSRVTFDLRTTYSGDVTASLDGAGQVPSFVLFDIGLRYRWQLGEVPSTLRLQLVNATDEFAWDVVSRNTFGLRDERHLIARWSMDL